MKRLVSVLDKKGFYLFDPTNGLFSGKPTSISFKEPESILVSEYLSPNQEKPKYLVMNPNSNPLNRDIEENFKKIMTSPQERINKTQTELAQTKSEIIYRGNTQNQYRFFVDHEEQRAEIESLYHELCPYGNKPIKKWLIKK